MRPLITEKQDNAIFEIVPYFSLVAVIAALLIMSAFPLPDCYAVIAILHSRTGALGQATAFPEVPTYCAEHSSVCGALLYGHMQPRTNFLHEPIVALDLLT